MSRNILTYRISDIVGYVDWGYFFHAWGLPFHFSSIAAVHECEACREVWVNGFEPSERKSAREAAALFVDARRELSRLSNYVSIRCVVRLLDASSSGDDIMLFTEESSSPTVLPMLRQQIPGKDGYCLCLSDFVAEKGCGKDTVGVFATSVALEPLPVSASGSVEADISTPDLKSDDYRSLLTKTLTDRLAEAAAERLHQEVRRTIWGYAPDEQMSVSDILQGRYQGIRPAVGYPCMPDLSLNFLFDRLLDFKAVGITLTEHGMMRPHSSVSGLMLSNPYARYFAVGHVLDDQLDDYARRRGIDVEEMRKYLK